MEPDLHSWRECKALFRKDAAAGVQGMRVLAGRGSLLAMLELGRALALGIGTTQNHAEAEKWFKRVADTRSVRGHFYLGCHYLQTKRYAEAKEALSFSAARGYAPAQHRLGRILLPGTRC